MIVQKILVGNNKSINQKNYIWNMIAGILNASEAIILSFAIMRITGLEDAGILTMAFATANLFVTIGKYGVRNYQVTDMEGISFSTYKYARYITVMIMIAISLGYIINGVLNRGYTFYKSGCIFSMCLILAVEAVEDVYAAKYQRMGRLDIGAKFFIIRWLGILSSYTVVLIVTRNLLIASVNAVCISLVIFEICKYMVEPQVHDTEKKTSIYKLLKECLPLCVSMFCSYYICNAPKYAIDKYMSDTEQASFGFVAMPVFAVRLLSTFIYQPIVVQLSDEWKNKEYKKVNIRVKRQIVMIGLLSLVCVLGAYFIGIPILSALYNTDLWGYKTELLLMVFGGGMLAMVNFLELLLIIMRKQKSIIICYLICSLSAMICFPFGATRYQTCGVAAIYNLIIATLMILLGILTIKCFKNAEKVG